MTSMVSMVCVFEQSMTGLLSTQSPGRRDAPKWARRVVGVFRHCPTSGGGGTSSAADDGVDEAPADDGVDETAVDDRVGRATAVELASLVHAVQATPMAIVASKAAARTGFSMSGSPFHSG
jgi:hypothetical protein